MLSIMADGESVVRKKPESRYCELYLLVRKREREIYRDQLVYIEILKMYI